MEFLKYLIIFVVFFLIIYILYNRLAVRPIVKNIRRKRKGKTVKRERNLPAEVQFLKGYYKIDVEKIGVIRVLRILNFVNALFLSLLVMVVLPFKEAWQKIIILVVLMIPTVWFVYYFLAKFLKHLERKSDKNV